MDSQTMTFRNRNRLMLVIPSFSFLMLFIVTISNAQEGSFDVNPSYGVPEEYEVEEVPNPEEVLINTDKETQSSSKISEKKKGRKVLEVDSIKTSSGTESGYNSDTKEAESVLSFNILYYIIQKFKFTEVVDQ